MGHRGGVASGSSAPPARSSTGGQPRPPVLDPVPVADPVEEVPPVPPVLRSVGELDAVVGQHGVDPLRHLLREADEEADGDRPPLALVELGVGQLPRPVDGDEEVELALLSADLGEVEVEVPELDRSRSRVALEPLLRRGLPLQLREPADPVALEAAVERGAREVGDRRLQRVEAVVQGEERVAAEGDDSGFLLRGEHGRARSLRSHRCVLDRLAPSPLGDGLPVNPMLLGQGTHSLLAALDGSADGLRRAGAAV